MTSLAPCTVTAARRYVKAWHRHLPELQGGLFAVQVLDDGGACMGVGVAGNPCMAWQGSGRVYITRVATPGAENACSMLYGALCRAAKALGYHEAWTYTLPHEPGTSLRAAGFMNMGLTDGGEWDRPSRPRKPVACAERKTRWLRILGQPVLSPRDYDAAKDFAGSLDDGYAAIRERSAAGGRAYVPGTRFESAGDVASRVLAGITVKRGDQ